MSLGVWEPGRVHRDPRRKVCVQVDGATLVFGGTGSTTPILQSGPRPCTDLSSRHSTRPAVRYEGGGRGRPRNTKGRTLTCPGLSPVYTPSATPSRTPDACPGGGVRTRSQPNARDSQRITQGVRSPTESLLYPSPTPPLSPGLSLNLCTQTPPPPSFRPPSLSLLPSSSTLLF